MGSLIVIGAGASGLAAAITAARRGTSVTVLEAMPSCGKKLLMTGNGHCNLASTLDPAGAYHGSDPGFAESLVREGREALFAFFRECGIVTRVIGNGYYPYSEEARSVLSRLLSCAEAAGVKIKTNALVTEIAAEESGYLVKTADWEYRADRVAVCCGTGASAPKEGPELVIAQLKAFGHTAAEQQPALTYLTARNADAYAWAGARARGSVSLFAGGKKIAASAGQIQFTAKGISGIPVMDISGTAGKSLREGAETEVRIDFFPEYTEEEIAEIITEKGREGEKDPLFGMLPEKVRKTVRNHFGEGGSHEMLAALCKAFPVPVRGTGSLAEAQCAGGGVPVTELYQSSMESVFSPGLYLCGEILDIDGICGGFNLSFAFLTGIRCGNAVSGGEA